MSAVTDAFDRAAAENRAAFIPYITGGFPDPETFLKLARALDENGADVIEVGIPFSDPMADGPVIQKASSMALENGATPGLVLDLIARFRETSTAPIVVMTYYNPVLQMGPESFARRASAAGVSGVLVPDLPPEEAGEWNAALAAAGLDTVYMAARSTPPDRLPTLLKATRGFLYYVSLLGVTGSEFSVTGGLVAELERLKRQSPVPVAVGFGVSRPDQASKLAQAADGVIVGSALVRAVLEDRSGDPVAALAGLAAGLSGALAKGNGGLS